MNRRTRFTLRRPPTFAGLLVLLTALLASTASATEPGPEPSTSSDRPADAVLLVGLTHQRAPAAWGAHNDARVPERGVTTEAALRAAWASPRRTRIDLAGDIFLRNCFLGDPMRESPYPMTVDGHGFAIRQTCFEKRVLRQDGTGFLTLRNLRMSRGGSDGPGAAVTSRGEILLVHCDVHQNLAEEPGGAIFSMRRITVRKSVLTGNLANDDGGALYARRGGVQVYDSNVSNNLVDGSGGAIGSTGDIVVVRSQVDGNTTDGDGGALYADEDGDVTVIDSSVDGSDADGPGGAIWTLDGDVAIYGSTLNGNRADDRGGAVGGESAVLVVNSTIARNLAVAHVGGGIWSRGDVTLINTTVTDNYSEGQGGGVLAAGELTLVHSTVMDNIATVAANLASGNGLSLTSSVVGPAGERSSGDTLPTGRNCQVNGATSSAYSWVTDTSCGAIDSTDMVGLGDPMLALLEADADGRVRVPLPGSPVIDVIPAADCQSEPEAPGGTGFLLDQFVDWQAASGNDARGTTRPQGPGCDVGAVELVVSP